MRTSLFRLFSLLLVAWPAHAQYIGNVGLQTTQQTLATTTACTGAAQLFPVKNLGQTQHYASFITQAQPTKFQAEIDGIDAQGNVYRISDVLENAFTPLINVGQGSLTASGYFPKIQIKITCSPGTATFTATYSGSQVTFNQNAGSYLNAQIDKVNYSNVSASAGQTDTVTTPFGSSSGTVYFQYSGGSVTGSTLTVLCSTNQFSVATLPALNVTPANVGTLQIFHVPAESCPLATVNYTSGGAGGTITTEYVFDSPGLGTIGTDPCLSGSVAKQSFPIAFGGGTTTQVVALVAGQSVYMCGYQIGQVAASGTFQWEYGTGATCGTGTNGLTGAIPLTASQAVSYSGPGYVAKTPQGNALCLVTTGAGNVTGIVTIVQTP
jgi:hypothetical protein